MSSFKIGMNVSFKYLLTFLAKAVFLLLLLECTFRWLIPAASSPYYVFDTRQNILRFDDKKLRDGLYTYGSLAEIRARWHVNNMGWINDRDYAVNGEKPVVAVIGNSYVEAFQVDPDQSLTHHLGSKLGSNYEVYSFGMSSANLSQYMQISRYVRRNFHPKLLILCLTESDVLHSRIAPGSKGGFTYFSEGPAGVTETVKPYVASAKSDFRKSALLRYLLFNSGVLSAAVPTNAVPQSPSKADLLTVSAFTDYAFGQIQRENPDSVVIIVLDAPRKDIYAGTLLQANDQTRKEVAIQAKKHGFGLIDLTMPMKTLYDENHLKFEFANNYHWNEYGHRVVADQIFQYLVKSGLAAPDRSQTPLSPDPQQSARIGKHVTQY